MVFDQLHDRFAHEEAVDVDADAFEPATGLGDDCFRGDAFDVCQDDAGLRVFAHGKALRAQMRRAQAAAQQCEVRLDLLDEAFLGPRAIPSVSAPPRTAWASATRRRRALRRLPSGWRTTRPDKIFSITPSMVSAKSMTAFVSTRSLSTSIALVRVIGPSVNGDEGFEDGFCGFCPLNSEQSYMASTRRPRSPPTLMVRVEHVRFAERV